ncbi:MAG: RsmG family class I SAM-dependent methyltransferase [Acidimicrobiia bacterium]
MAACLPAGTERVLDLGSGGGVPGLVLAVDQPALRLVLVDSAVRRCRFLREATDEVGAGDRVEVVEERAETAARHPTLRGAFDVVVARLFGSPGVTAECAVGFLRLGGSLIVSEPPEEAERWPPEPLADLGLAPATPCGAGEFGFVRLEKIRMDDRWPRRVGIPAKRPCF